MYKFLRSVLFSFDPEKVHYFSMNALKSLCSIGFIRNIIKGMFQPKGNIQFSMFNLPFSNRVGLGAGFDKNALYLDEVDAMGFGFVEIGTVTPLPQEGNEKPRLFRLPADKALINRMGFNNDGMEVITERLRQWRIGNGKWQVGDTPGTRQPVPGIRHRVSRLIIGGNIGKNKLTPNEFAWMDYEKCFTSLHPYVDYFVVNVSSPNTPGLRELQEKEALRKILTVLQTRNSQLATPKPLLLKIAPDLTNEQIDDVMDLAMEIKLDGLVACNTTLDRSTLSQHSMVKCEKIGIGGLSGLPAKKRSTEIVAYISDKTNGRLPIIASGGIFTAADAKEKINAGASLVQVWTGFIYEGPAIVKNICRELT
ncbi:MAG: quinone-dependent dihydroorotate dehydrogenase [Rhizobacter sp.]|nr:quinone-dependent dihydroorotate dehydrogenase [Ferruginibacter sp.]